MSLYIDLKYINLISNRLLLFKRKSQTTFNFRCPICGDSQKKKNRARGYFYRIPNKNEMAMHCYNCSASFYFGKFLQTFDPVQYKEYCLEKFKDNGKYSVPETPQINFKVDETRLQPKKDLMDELFQRITDLPEDNIAYQFCLKRKIPVDQLSRLYFIDDIKKVEALSEKYKDKIQGTEPRLVIPFYNQDKQFEGVSCRALGSESLRYITVKVNEDANMIFGIDQVNVKKKVYAVEGPIDSLFLPNCIAVGGTAFVKLSRVNIPKENLVIILDNQPRNIEVCKQYKRYIDSDYKICIWPQTIKEKDINDMVLSGSSPEKVKSIIDKNTFQGVEAQLKFISWKRCL